MSGDGAWLEAYGHLRPMGPWLLALALGGGASPALARKTNQAIYEDPFDLAAGGTSLTFAAKEGRLFANPALMPHGGRFHHWAGSTFSLLTNRESVDTVRTLANQSGGEDSGDEGAEAEAGGSQELVDQLFEDPVRVGWGFSLSWLTNNFGLALFSRLEADFVAQEFGETGVPEARFRAESYQGAALGSAIRTPWRWLAFGLTGRYVLAAEPDVAVVATNRAEVAALQEPSFIESQLTHNRGVAVDFGMLLFLQSSWFDFKLAGKVDDIGNTQLSGDGPSKEFKQVVSAGTGVTLHTGADAVHFAVDYRDILDAYGEESFKKIYAGTRVTLRTYLGLAAGFYNGYPTMGAELDLVIMRLAATYYTRELGDHPGVEPRRMMLLSLSMGY